MTGEIGLAWLTSIGHSNDPSSVSESELSPYISTMLVILCTISSNELTISVILIVQSELVD